MKKLFIFFALLTMCQSFLWSQDYFWSGERKVYVTPDPHSVVVLYEDASHPQARKGIPTHLQRKVFYIDREPEVFSKLQQSGIQTDKVKDIASALITEEGIELWPSQKVLYSPNEEFDADIFEVILSQFPGTRIGKSIGGFPFVAFNSTDHVLDFANQLYESGMVEYSMPDFLFSTQAASPQGPHEAASCTPADTFYKFQYYLENTSSSLYLTADYPYHRSKAGYDIDGPEAWCMTTGDSSITIAVVDVGVEAHEDLVDKSGNSRVLAGISTVDPINSPTGGPISNPSDPQAHGQAIAGIIAASHNDIGVAGIAPEVKILPVHISLNITSISEAADAINYAWKNGADIINNSWASDFCTSDENFFPPVLSAIDSALKFGRNGLGCFVVYASGVIDASNTSTCVRYPASISAVYTVSAMDAFGDRPLYSPFGAEVDIAGVTSPSTLSNVTALDRMGNNGYNTDTTNSMDYPDRNYTRWFGGTSAASAQVSGIAALMLSVNPALDKDQLAQFMTQAATSIPTDVSGFFGAGRANAQAAVTLAMTSFPVEWAYVNGEVENSSVKLTWATFIEENTSQFVVERSNQGIFEQLDAIPAAGDSQELREYEYFDSSPRRGRNIYRLKQEDIDGRFSYSQQVEVTFTPDREFFTPTNFSISEGYIDVELFNQSNQILDYTLIDIHGRKVNYGLIRPDQKIFKAQVPVPNIAPGIYILKIGQGYLWSESIKLIANP